MEPLTPALDSLRGGAGPKGLPMTSTALVAAPRPPKCPCTLPFPSRTPGEAALARHTVLDTPAAATTGLTTETAVEYFTCRLGAWHWIPVVGEVPCPCGRTGYASLIERNHAGHRATATQGTEAVRARFFTCLQGGYHWTWGPARNEKRVHPCMCGQGTRFTSEENAELVAAHFRALHPHSQVVVYTCRRPRWHLRITGPGEEHYPPPPQFDYCACGKAASASEEEARALHERIAARRWAKQETVRFYRCRHHSWHWTKDVEYERCQCGEVEFAHWGNAIKEARAATRRHRAPEFLEGRAYRCRHGGHHWTWYARGQDVSTCACDRVLYLTEHEADLIAEFRTNRYPESIWAVSACGDGWHVDRVGPPRNARQIAPSRT